MMKTYIIAEAGVNHNGSIELAKRLIDVAIESGVDSVKFQTFKAENVISKYAIKAEYQIENTGDGAESQLEMVKKLELSREETLDLRNYCKEKGIQFLSSPFDMESIDFLNELDVPRFKIPSGEITNAPFLLKIGQLKKPMILSTGMSNLEEIKLAVGVLAFGFLDIDGPKTEESFLRAFDLGIKSEDFIDSLTILHCTTEYPCPAESVNLSAMETIRSSFPFKVGYSDHTEGTMVPMMAVANGATLIEKHFTLNKEMEGPDHRASLDPRELKEMVERIRYAEAVRGSSAKECSSVEKKNLDIARKSLVAKIDIKEGESFSEANLTVKRPGSGISPMRYWSLLGTSSTKSYNEDDLI